MLVGKNFQAKTGFWCQSQLAFRADVAARYGIATIVHALIVDSNTDDCATLVAQLRQQGYEPIGVSSVREARQALERQSFDLLLLELTLPDGDGRQLCNEIRERLGDGAVIIFVSTTDSALQRATSLELGADDFLGKPCDEQELRVRVEAHVRRRTTFS